MLPIRIIIPLFFFFSISAYTQEWKKNLPPNPDFFDVKKAFYDYWNAKPSKPIAQDFKKLRDGELQQFQRWENFMKFRARGKGKINSSVLWEEWEKNKFQKKSQPQKTAIANWALLGPTEIPAQGGGMGRLNTIEFHPTNADIFWVGSASGGLWKTINGGISWSTTTDLLPAIGISDIAIDLQNPDNMFIATGDGYGYESGTDFWGGTYTAGVLKSTDGGITWNSTGLTYSQNQGRIIQRLIISPSNPQMLLAASRDGLWRTDDGGNNWTKVSTVHFYDLEFNVGDDNIIYASSGNHIYRSVNLGQNWSMFEVGICGGGRQSIAVAPSNPNVIYSLCESGSFHKSTDGGATFTEQTFPSITFYGYYDNVLAVSPVDENKIYVGGLELGMSSDGGQTWEVIDDWWGWPDVKYCHADKHDIAFAPNNGNAIFICNDGGIFKSTDGGNSYVNLSSGISISQFYRMGGSATNENIFYCGQQDNGVIKSNFGDWGMVVFADGMECAVDYLDDNNVLVATQNGQLNRSNDGGNSFSDVSPAVSGSWVTPFAYHPFDPSIVFAGYDELYKSNDGGWSWNSIGNPTNNITMDVLAIAPSNPDYIYAGTISELYRSSNGGVSWQLISDSVPLNTNALTYVAVSNNDPLKLWMTLSGYTPGEKVYFSTNGGNTWTNISGTIPNVPVNCIVYQKNTPDVVYIGTDFGVYYRDSSMTDWATYNENLPNVIIYELEIQYNAGKLRAATYGRGLWESDLVIDPLSIQINDITKGNGLNIFPNPSSGKINISFNNFQKSQGKISVYNLPGMLMEEKIISGSEITPIFLDLSTFPAGMYFVEATINEERFLKKIVLKD